MPIPEKIDWDAFKVSPKAQLDPSIGRVGYSYDLSKIDCDDSLCVAKKTRDDDTGRDRFWIKTKVAGGDGGRLFDPQDHHVDDLRRRDRLTASALFVFREVPEVNWLAYLQYLRSGNPTFLRQAERE